MDAKIFMSVSQLTKYIFLIFLLGAILGGILGGLMVSKIKNGFKGNKNRFHKNK
ncbi:hypothetical protein CcarbDRAFT_0098 [Clostridium carboxidivorans P7]|uniref:Uncharacterized protein n=1 Tax=Clostridium carboxidivorans P7 TaxID=536227 RepID=C6PMT1_9CLOT|nr:hypothetical protein [Clostridium carboxidivorans]EET89509.1 hypothetical protein CcarbDRAFT_0098 [Clostridium carboxidivorans P7]